MMKRLDITKFKCDEKFSNHAVQGFSYEDCPIKKSCFAMATGFGGAIINRCEYFNDKGYRSGYCTCPLHHKEK